MHLILLLIAASAQYVRQAQAGPFSEPVGSRVWVFFTDKGIFTDEQYSSATRHLELSAALPVRQRRSGSRVQGFDFDDLPVREDYIRRIEGMGARLRTTSRWLNAASFEMSPHIARQVWALPFVHAVKPVCTATETLSEPAIELPQPAIEPQARGLDTARAHRFWGAAWDQAYMLGVPEVAARGYFGTGVKLAIFDTGLKLKNRALAGIRIWRQHDFISGDNFYCTHIGTGAAAIPISNLRYLGLVKDPVLIALPPDSASGTGWRLLLAFVADSFSYQTTSMSKRGLFSSFSTDQGLTWSAPQLLYISRPEDQTFEDLAIARRGNVSYLAYHEFSQNSGNPSAIVYCGWFIGTDWTGQREVGAGRSPHIVTLGDSLYLVYLASDTMVAFRKALITSAEPAWYGTVPVCTAAEPLNNPQVLARADGSISVFCSGKRSGRIYHYRSSDRGNTFARQEDIVTSGASSLKLFANSSRHYLFYKDYRNPPFVRLSALVSSDLGISWQAGAVPVTDALTIGSYCVAAGAEAPRHDWTLHLLYESAGLICRRSTADPDLSSWYEPEPLDTAGFCYSPTLARFDQTTAAVWFKRGDDNTVWEESDTLRFSRDQSDHGTRMTSLIAGWLPYTLVGIAPAVDLLVAKTEFHKSRGNRYYEYNIEEDTYIAALEWAEAMGAEIVSTSLGYRGWYRRDQFDGRTALVSVAAAMAARRGLLICTAMGNRDSTRYPWPQPYIVAPGDAEGIITCGGVQRSGLAWRGSGTGPTSDGRIKPDFVALSDTVAVASPEPATDTSSLLDGSVGTSCATALIAGACALIKEAHPTWGAESIITALRLTSSRSVPNCTLGYGIPRVDSLFKIFPPEKQTSAILRDEIGLVYPNPFIPAQHTRVYFGLNLANPTPRASIAIYTASGVLVDTLSLRADLLTRPGRYGDEGDIATLEQLGAWWDGHNVHGRPVAAGLYLAVLRTTFGRSTTRFAIVR